MMAKVKVITLKGSEKSGSKSLRLAPSEFKRISLFYCLSFINAKFISY